MGQNDKKSNRQLIVESIFQIIVIGWGIFAFFWSQWKLENHEAKVRNDQKKFDTYYKIGESIGAIASHDIADSNLQKDINTFYRLYAGEAMMLDDTNVQNILIKYRFTCHEYLNKRKTVQELREQGFELCDSLRIAVRNMANDDK